MTRRFVHIGFLFILLGTLFVNGQSKRQMELEERRKQYQAEIEQINKLQFQERKEEKSLLAIVEDLHYKIAVRQSLINITNQQANLLTREINANQEKITSLRKKLQFLKDEYAAMVVKSYKSKSQQSRVMFLMSSINFQQAYKRLQYIKQYADHQKKQAEEIKIQTQKLQELNQELSVQKQDKQKLIEANRKEKGQLQKERKEQEVLVASIKSNLNQYSAQIRAKQQEIDKIDKEIERIIREEIAKSNKKAGKSSNSKTFALTPEEKRLSTNFTSNKGKLPWPVTNGVIKIKYGINKSPIDRTVPIKSNGVRIATAASEKVRVVFDGIVLRIMTPKNGNNAVMIKHGNYITVYKNVTNISVQQGDKVSTKQVIGEVIKDRASGESMLSFSIWKDGKTQNPAHWIYKM